MFYPKNFTTDIDLSIYDESTFTVSLNKMHADFNVEREDAISMDATNLNENIKLCS